MKKPLVSIICTSYNHESYLHECLKGFVMQETTFPFEIIIHDDASTDGSQDIIREYTSRYPHLFIPILQKKNQFSQGVKIGPTFMYPKARGKYIAECEGDDYWTDPYKLQKQVDWLEGHPSCVMVCSDAYIKTPKNILDWHRYEEDYNIPVQDMILGGGLFIQTATIIYKRSLRENYPKCCQECHVGDYPLQIWASLQGEVRYMTEKTATYRFMHEGSWTANQAASKSRILGYLTEVNMLRGLDKISQGKYHKSFEEKACTLECQMAILGLISPAILLKPKYWKIQFGRKQIPVLFFKYFIQQKLRLLL